MEKELTKIQRLENLIKAYNDVLMCEEDALCVDKKNDTWTITSENVNPLMRLYLLLDAETHYCCYYNNDKLKVVYLD